MNFLNLIIKKSLLDIRFWIILFFAIRLFHITNPPLEVSHNWRQTTVSMVARNFYEVNANIFYPRLDIDGDNTGITGMEFPILNYLMYLCSILFGVDDWYGRLINLIISSVGVYFFYKLILKYFDFEIAFFSAILLMFSIWFPFSRKIMPDTFSVSLVIMCIYYGTNYFDKKRNLDLILYVLFFLSGVLAKLPSGYLLIIFVLFLFNSRYELRHKLIFSLASFIAVVPVLVWYFYWVPHLNSTFRFIHFYMGTSITDGFLELKNNLWLTLTKFFDNSMKHIAFFFFLFGLYKAFKLKNSLLLSVYLITSFGFLIVMLKAGHAFHHHNYYIIPFVPVMAFVCGYGIFNLPSRKIKFVVLVIISLEGILNYHDDFFIKKDDSIILNLEKDFDKCSNRNDLIVINSGEKPTPMYFAHRKGWVTFNDSIASDRYLNLLKTKGLRFVLILKKSFGDEIVLDLPVCISNESYTIYKII
jgi:hypothetical protein